MSNLERIGPASEFFQITPAVIGHLFVPIKDSGISCVGVGWIRLCNEDFVNVRQAIAITVIAAAGGKFRLNDIRQGLDFRHCDRTLATDDHAF